MTTSMLPTQSGLLILFNHAFHLKSRKLTTKQPNTFVNRFVLYLLLTLLNYYSPVK